MTTRSNPIEELERFVERMGRQIEESAGAWESDGPFGRWRAALEPMAVDLVERDDEFVATVDLPGYERDDVEIKVTDHTLRIRAERSEAVEEEDDRYIRRERSREAARRSIRLPEAVDTAAVNARMHNGVLTITMPKLEADEARTIEIE